jgi:glutamate synthase domain-containing protein 3
MKEGIIKIRWQVDDGYAGGSRPQSTEIDKSELEQCDTFEEAKELIENAVQEDYENKVSWSYGDWNGIEETINEVLSKKKMAK